MKNIGLKNIGLLGIVAVIGLLVMFTSVTTEPTVLVVAPTGLLTETVPVTNDLLGFTASVPKTWEKIPIPNTLESFALPSTDPNKRPVFTIALEQLPRVLTLDEYTKALLGNLPVMFPDTVILNVSDVTLSGFPARQVTYTATVNAIKVRTTSTFMTNPQQPLALGTTFMSPVEMYDANAEDAVAAVASFKFK